MADEARALRQKAIADKKKRLEELKARRSQRSTAGAAGVTADANKAKSAGSANLDDYIDGLLKVPAAKAVSTPAAEAPSVAPAPSSGSGVGEAAADVSKSEGSASVTPNNVTAEPAPAPLQAPVKQVETYTAGTQTEDDDFPPVEEFGDEDQYQAEPVEGENDPNAQEASYRNYAEEDTPPEEAKVLTAEEMEFEVTSAQFSSFLNEASKKVERVLGSSVMADLLVDYTGEAGGAKRTQSKAIDGSKFLSSRQVYECPKWTATRDVTDMDWSPLHRELMLSSYHMQSSTSSLGRPMGSSAVAAVGPDDTPSASLAPRSGELQSDGLALVWSLAMPSRPEHIFTCGSPVISARFHPTESPLVIGGCQSGQVVVWDVRAGRMPVQKSSLTTTATGGKGHAHPICAMEIVEGGNGLVTGASDGRVNFWSLGNLRDPAESLQVGDSFSCLAVAPESGTLVCGDEMGSMYVVQSSQGALGGGGGQRSRRQVRKLDPGNGEGHFGMITSLSTKFKASGRAGLSKGFLRGSGGCFLSAGVDWTVKFWAPAYSDKPLMSLVSHSYDYMSDVEWNPNHPALCATASSNGTIGLWNFSQSLEEPITGSDGIVVEPDGGSGRGLNKLKWSSDGRRMLVASADRVHVLSLSEEVIRQKGDEDARMMNHLISRGLLERE